MTNHRNAALILTLCGACSGSVTVTMGSQYVKTATFGPNGGTLTVAASDDATLQGTQIVIPPGALSAQTTIKIGVTNQAVVSTGALGPIIDFEPSGTVFAMPATVTIPVTLGGVDPSRVGVMAVEPGGSSHDIRAVKVTSAAASTLATFQVSGFTHYGAHDEGADSCTPTCGDDATCGSSDGCGGTCDGNCDDGGTGSAGATTGGFGPGGASTTGGAGTGGASTVGSGTGGTGDPCGTGGGGTGTFCGTGGTGGGAGTSSGGACTYPVEVDGGNMFPDVALGDGWINFTGAIDIDADAGLLAVGDALLQLHCSGERYALIDVSAAWCPHSQQFAVDIPGGYEPEWLAEGGVVLTVLEGNSANSGQATDADLTTWATNYQTNYSLVNDPQSNLPTALGSIEAWPAQYIVRLSDMQIVQAVLGANDAFYEDFTVQLEADAGM